MSDMNSRLIKRRRMDGIEFRLREVHPDGISEEQLSIIEAVLSGEQGMWFLMESWHKVRRIVPGQAIIEGRAVGLNPDFDKTPGSAEPQNTPCPTCGGSGDIDHTVVDDQCGEEARFGDECPTCGGSGSRNVTYTDGVTGGSYSTNCPNCHGTGEEER